MGGGHFGEVFGEVVWYYKRVVVLLFSDFFGHLAPSWQVPRDQTGCGEW